MQTLHIRSYLKRKIGGEKVLDFIIEFILAMIFILCFKVQKLFFPSLYFAFSDPFIRRESIGVSKYFFRFFVIFFFNAFFYLILKRFYEAQEIFELLLISSFLGAFLILWPIIFRRSRNLEGEVTKKSMFFLYCIYISFLISTLVISFLTTSSMNLFFKDMDIVTIYISNKEGIIFEILMLPIISVFEVIFTNKYRSVRNEDDSKFYFNNNHNFDYEDTEDEEDDDYDKHDHENSKIYHENSEYKILCIAIINLALATFNVLEKKKRKN